MNEKTDIKKHLSNPFLWFAIVSFVVAGVTSYNQIGQNATYIETVENRLKKKIEIINDLEARTLEIEMQLIQRGESINDLQNLREDVIGVRVEVAKLEKDIEHLKHKH